MILNALDECSNGGVPIDHIFANSDVCRNDPVFYSSQNVQNSLNTIDPNVFQSVEQKESGGEEIIRLSNGKRNILKAEPMMIYTFFPSQSRGISLATRDTTPEPISHPPVFQEQIAALKKTIQSCPPAPFSDDIECTFLGTGAALPSKYRNVSSILLRFQDSKAVLLDCGEGTFFQLCRRFGLSKAREIIQKELELVWISHMHADHHLGLLRILVEREPDNKLTIIAPKAMHFFLQEYEHVDERVRNTYTFERCQVDDENTDSITMVETKKRLELQTLSSVRVRHCFDAFGVVLVCNSGFKFVYSGDTEPCEELVTAGMNAHVLIHEATLDDEKVLEAREKKHSTISEAITVGRNMKARKVLLTHFSQRYPKIPIVKDENANVAVAFDLMSLNLNQMEYAHKLLPILQTMFSNKSEDDGGKDDNK